MSRIDKPLPAVLIRFAERLVLKQKPFFGRIVNSWCKTDYGVKTVGVGVKNGNIHLYYNSKFVSGVSMESLAAVLEHECGHIILGHIHRHPEGFQNMNAWITACEVTANEFVSDPSKLPGRPLLLNDLGLARGESTLQRYFKLSIGERFKIRRPVPLDDHGYWLKEQDKNSKQSVKRALSKMMEQAGVDEIRSLPGKIQKRMQNQGIIAGSENQKILEHSQSSTIGWRYILSRYQKVEHQQRITRPSRRLPHLTGIVPACRRVATKKVILIAVDTSGSMDREVFGRVKSEVDNIASIARVILVQCDNKIQGIDTNYTMGSLCDITGRGGTSLKPPFDLIKSHRAELIVYFSDGMGPAPSDPPDVPVIWCLTPNGKRPADWGCAIRMSSLQERRL